MTEVEQKIRDHILELSRLSTHMVSTKNDADIVNFALEKLTTLLAKSIGTRIIKGNK